ncbi:GNAT family N-acetyltransferase [Psychromonas sp. MME2]|uniref:tRNA(Met) cytidine acetyltransferase TmcA n=1 Tax=unclassified Psychromonas TaxID=2614957 RepID=UPI00339C72A0
MHALISLIDHLQLQAQASNHRQILRLRGTTSWCFQQCSVLIEDLPQPYFWIGDAPTGVTTTPYQTILGQETPLLFINAIAEFDANAFAAAEGTLRGGGLLILLSPLTIDDSDYFYHFIDKQLQQYNFITIAENAPIAQINNTFSPATSSFSINTREQEYAVRAIVKTVTGHRRRPLVLTANRGRGKSAALGIAAATLLRNGIKKILVCAPSKRATFTLFKHASLLLGKEAHQYAIINGNQSIQFIAPDALLENRPNCDLLIIDEAAAIPIPMLESFVCHYARIVFASTLHGYEGSGRGFALRFQKRLTEIAPQWRKCHLKTPIRWSENDPLEHFTLNNLCLSDDATTPQQYDEAQPVQFYRVTAAELIADKNQLTTIFSLLINAHYQTKPSDLAMMLNDNAMHIFLFKQNQQILGVALVNSEGGFSPLLAEQVWQGTRRVQGNLIAQSLTFHSGHQGAAQQHFARIQRIAIHPTCQRQGVGKLFVKSLTTWALDNHFDHLGASFAATAYLLSFWQQLGFTTLRVGTTQDSSSGAHSLIVNYPLSNQGKKLHRTIQENFQLQLPLQLSRHLQRLDPELVSALLAELNNQPQDTTQLISYIAGNRPFETVEYQLQQLLLNSNLHRLDKKQQSLAIQKILQNNSWHEVCDKNQYTGKKEAQRALKNAIQQLTQK